MKGEELFLGSERQKAPTRRLSMASDSGSGLVDHPPITSLHPSLRHGGSDMASLPADISSPAALAALSDEQLAGLSSLCAAERERGGR